MTAPKILRSSGRAKVGLSRHPDRDDLMVAVLQVVAVGGSAFAFELTVDDLRNVRADLGRLLDADAATVSRWWRELANGSDGRPAAVAR